jgi:hypothetical protein
MWASELSGCSSNSGTQTAMGSQPISIIHPVNVFRRQRRLPARSSTVPNAHEIAAARMNKVPIGERVICRTSSPSRTAMPSMPSGVR